MTTREENTSLRDRLKQQAAQALEQQKEAEDQRAEDQAFFSAELLPIMLNAAEYFGSIVKDLETIGQDTTALFPLGPTADSHVPFVQSDYSFYIDDENEPTELGVSCYCELSVPVTRVIHSTKEADEFETVLREMGIVYHRRRQDDLSNASEERSRFRIEGGVKAGFTLRAVPRKRCFELNTRNLEDRPSRRHVLMPSSVNEGLLENLGRVLLRESNVLPRGTVNAETRAALEAAALERKREIEKAVAEARSLAQAEAENRLDRKLVKRARRLIDGQLEGGRRALRRTLKRK